MSDPYGDDYWYFDWWRFEDAEPSRIDRPKCNDLRDLLVRAEEQLFIMTQCFKFEECGYSRSATWDVMIEIRKCLSSQPDAGSAKG
jgi:hypothetical protein